MYKKNKITLALTDTQLYEQALSYVSNPHIRKSLLDLLATFTTEDAVYRASAITNNLHSIMSNDDHQLPEEIARWLHKLYEYYLSKKGHHLRTNYDQIMASWVNDDDSCPYCGAGHITEMDHFLPASRYGFFSVNTNNLIPSCHLCNKEKLAFYSQAPYENFLHPYYDDITNYQWLTVNLTIVNHKIIPTFSCYNDGSIPAITFARIEFMFQKLKLNSNHYSNRLSNDIAIIKDGFKHGELSSLDDNGIKIHFNKTHLQYQRIYGKNNYLTVFYKKLSELEDYNLLRYLIPPI